jgi:hypothetical protein
MNGAKLRGMSGQARNRARVRPVANATGDPTTSAQPLIELARRKAPHRANSPIRLVRSLLSRKYGRGQAAANGLVVNRSRRTSRYCCNINRL